MHQGQLIFDVMQGSSSTVVTVFSGNGFSATGESKCGPGDKYDEEIGVMLALARALDSLSDDMERFAIARSFIQHRP